MKVIRILFISFTLLTLSACSMFQFGGAKTKPVEVVNIEERPPMFHPPLPMEMQMVNFDWDRIEDVLAKVEEELQEVKDEMFLDNNHQKTKEEIGDLLFSVAQLSRHLNIDPEEALKDANLKFIKRINQVEDHVKADGKKMIELSTEQLEEVWQKIKKKK